MDRLAGGGVVERPFALVCLRRGVGGRDDRDGLELPTAVDVCSSGMPRSTFWLLIEPSSPGVCCSSLPPLIVLTPDFAASSASAILLMLPPSLSVRLLALDVSADRDAKLGGSGSVSLPRGAVEGGDELGRDEGTDKARALQRG